MSTIKISKTPLTSQEKEAGVIAGNQLITDLVAGYDENESWMITENRTARVAFQLTQVEKARTVVIDMPRTFELHLRKSLQGHEDITVAA